MLGYAEPFYRRFGPALLVALLALSPLLVWGFLRAIETNTNNVEQWLPEDYEDTTTYQWFRRHFESDEFAFVSWDGCTLDDPRLAAFAERIVAAGGSAGGEHPPLFKNVHTGPGMLETLTEPPFNLSRNRAVDRLQGFVIGKDGRTTAALVTLSDYGNRHRVQALERLEEVAEQVGIDPEALHLSGGPVFNAHIDIASERAIGTLSGWAVGIAVCVALLSLRSIRLTAAVFVTAAYCGLLGQALVYFTGGKLNLVLVVMPILVALLSLSASVHLVNYYRDARAEGNPAGAPARAVRRGFAPCALAALTTAIGLASLQVSHVVPVHDFGLYSAVGIIAGLVVVFLMLPSLLTLIERASAPRRGNAGPRAEPRAPGSDRIRRLLRPAAEGVFRRRVWVTLLCGAALVAGAWGVAHIETEVSARRFFPEDSRLLQDYRWVEDHFSPTAPLEVVVVFDKDASPLDLLERMRLVRDVQRELEEVEGVYAAVSALTFAPPLEYQGAGEPGGLLSAFGRTAGVTPRRVWRTALSRRLEQHRDEFADQGYLSDADGEELWRISTRTGRQQTVETKRFLDHLAARIAAFLDSQGQRRAAGVRVVYTGTVPLFYVAQRELLDGLFRSFITAFALIAVLMVVVLRSVGGGLLAMLPNVFPAAVVFGTMGHLGIRVDIGSMLTASAAMGIAVDNTVHYLSWFRRGLNETGSRRSAIVHAYRNCAAAMCQTTAIAGLGLLVYASSSFQPVSQFGLLISLLLMVAVVGDLIFLPALLAGFAGRVFGGKGGVRTSRRSPSPA